MKKIRVAAIACGLLIALVVWVIQSRHPHVSSHGSKSSYENDRIQAEPAKEVLKRASREGNSTRKKRTEAFDELVAEWKAKTFDKDGYPISDIGPLTEKSASKLLCSQEMLYLLEILRTSGAQIAARSLHEKLISKLGSEDGQTYRESILEISDDNNPYVDDWFYILGTKCPDEEFGRFKISLGDKQDFARALLVREITKSKTPETLVEEIIDTIPQEYFEASYPSELISYPLFKDILRDLPENSNWLELLNVVPPAKGGNSCSSNRLRQNMISRWSNSDFVGAANHIINNGHENSLIELRSLEVCDENRQAATLYLEGLSPGPAFDAIAERIARSYLTTNLEKSREFADQIRDPIKRDKVVQDIMFDLGTSGNRGN